MQDAGRWDQAAPQWQAYSMSFAEDDPIEVFVQGYCVKRQDATKAS